jgi:hypothetical protein
MKIRISLAAALALAALLGACASTPMPTQQLAVAQAAVKQADTSSTADDAGTELQVAKSKLAAAQQAEARKDYVLAAQLADQAQVDAQVAQLHAQSMRSRKAAQDSQDAARVLREELARKAAR